MDNTLKAKFFACYLGQEVVYHESDNCNFKLTEISYLDLEVGIWGDWSGGTHPQQSCNDLIGIDAVCLNLKPLSLISDEDAIELAKFCGWSIEDPLHAKALILTLFRISSNDHLKTQMMFDFSDISSAVDKIRSMGYAYKWIGITVEQQVEKGWTKLTE